MCGIVGYIGKREAVDVLMSGLEKLEYRGYDSAGIAVSSENQIKIFRAVGKLEALRKSLQHPVPESHVGIGHTRWATHGRPTENNAHPHSYGRVSLIHNGIIENYVELRKELVNRGHNFNSETDTEIAAHLVDNYLNEGMEPLPALERACKDIRGSYAFLYIDSEHQDRILVAKNASPVVIGIGEGEMFIASDILAVLNYTKQFIILEEGDFAEVRSDDFVIRNGGETVTRELKQITWDPVTAQKGGYKHFMLKEIHDQPQVISETLRGHISQTNSEVMLEECGITDEDIKRLKRVILVGCGTAWHAALIAKFYIETLAGLPCDVDYASELRYRKSLVDAETLVIAVSQSGETADTLAAVDILSKSAKTIAICNVVGSSLTRKVDGVFYTHAGPEISVASTKAFTTQLTAAYLLAVYLGTKRGVIDSEYATRLIADLTLVPNAINATFSVEQQIQNIANKYHSATNFLYIARGVCYPIALEGALKLKEISYVHAEGYPAGELKHGPIALVDEKMPIVVILQESPIFEKTLSNLKEVESRNGQIIAVTDTDADLSSVAKEILQVPHVSELLSPIVFSLPLQLLAYYMAVFNGTDVDLPRNLAKSVTVE